MTHLSDLRFYATHPHPCSYLEDRDAVTLFVDPQTPMDRALYSRLSEVGFRRSGEHVYRPHCEKCGACVPARIPVQDFKPSRSQRRVLNRNQDLHLKVIHSIATEEHFALYNFYIEQRHHDGDMYPANREQFHSFLSRQWDSTEYHEHRLGDELVALAVTDRLDHGLSAIYTFFRPDLDSRSLGTWCILSQIDYAKAKGLDFLYLGYWIKNCQKMSYKTRYRPLELYHKNRWITAT